MKRKLRPSASKAEPSVPSRRIIGALAVAVSALALIIATVWVTRAPVSSQTPSITRPTVAATLATSPASTDEHPAGVTMASTKASRAPLPAKSRQATSGQAEDQTFAGSAGQRAFVDPKTGRLRPAEHDDLIAMKAAEGAQRRAARTAVASEPQPMAGPGGAVGMNVPEELQTFMVATRTPDGRLVLEHATGPKEAQAKARAGASKDRKAAGKEDRNDR